MQMIR